MLRAAIALVVVLLSAVSARADAPRLSDQGRILISGALGGAYSNDAESPGLTAYPDWAVWIAPSLLYFIRDRLGVGGYLDYGFQRRPMLRSVLFTEHVLGLGVQGVSELVLTPRLGLFAFVSFGYAHVIRSVDDITTKRLGPSGVGRTIQQQSPLRSENLTEGADCINAGLFLPLVFHLNESIGVGLGPSFFWQTYLGDMRDPERELKRYHLLELGASTWIGGSF